MQDYVEQREGGFYIAGTRISLDSVVYPFKNGASPESILRSSRRSALSKRSTAPSRSIWRTKNRWKPTSKIRSAWRMRSG
jgi:hypothetical protein